MELVLDYQIGRQQPLDRQFLPSPQIARPVETFLVVTFHTPKKCSYFSCPRQGCKLINRGDHEAREPPINRLIDREDGQRDATRELTLAVYAGYSQIGWGIRIGQQLERHLLELRSAPGALFQWNRGRLPVVIRESYSP